MESDPCIFRLCNGTQLRGICSLHVDDVLIAGDQIGWASFSNVLKVFRHSGIQKLTQEENMTIARITDVQSAYKSSIIIISWRPIY